jgi:cysteine-rich repeat protein
MTGAMQPHPCCGDRLVETSVGEECDDGNTVAGDGCSPTCKKEGKAAACCAPSGCIDLANGGPGAQKKCKAEGGSLFYGKTCKELNYCGHHVYGGCVTSDGVCHEPWTETQCTGAKGKWLANGCPPNPKGDDFKPSCGSSGPCQMGQTCCGQKSCVDLSKDEANCGACGKACPRGWSCAKGICRGPK